MTNRDKLKQIKYDYDLTRQQLADIIGVPLATLNGWMLPDTSKASRACPDMVLELLKYKLKSRKKK